MASKQRELANASANAVVDSSDSSDDEPLFQAPPKRRGLPATHRRRLPQKPVGQRAKRRFVSSDESDDEPVATPQRPRPPARVASVTRPNPVARRRDKSFIVDSHTPRTPARPQIRKRARPLQRRPATPPAKKRRVHRSKVSDYPQKAMPLVPLEPVLGAPKWWEVEPYKGATKWKSLDHNGILFPPPYKQHHVKILYDGRPVDLDPQQEELASFYAMKLETPWVKKKAFNKNFFAEFRRLLIERKAEIRHPEICDFKKLNFRPIYEHHMREREAEKQRKKAPAYRAKLKQDKADLDEIYGYAIVDGVREKVGNYRVEPPGLFLGRGDHPKAGMLKKRLRPSQITINIGHGSALPPCPVPGEQWGAIVHDPTVTYIAKWVENINQSHKMVYLHASSRFKGQADMAKYDKARKLKTHIGRIRADYERKLKSPQLSHRQLATCMYIIDRLSIRVGNEKDTDEEADTVGVCSFRVEHLSKFERTEDGLCKVTLDFLGKDSMRYLNTVDLPQLVYKNMRQFTRNKKADQDVFEKIDPSMINDYLKSHMDGLSAKVFRTHNASVTLEQELQKLENFQLADQRANITVDSTVHEKKYFYDVCNKEVAILCNHKRTVNQESFNKSTARLDEKIEKAEAKIKELNRKIALASGRAKPKNSEERSWSNKDPDTFRGQRDRKQAALDKLKMNKSLKHENKEVALGTSKINYMDPRITVAFCKRMELPIEKVFNKALLDKFPWAMAVSPDYKF